MRPDAPRIFRSARLAACAALLLGLPACASSGGNAPAPAPDPAPAQAGGIHATGPATAPTKAPERTARLGPTIDPSVAGRMNDPRVGLGAGLLDAEIAIEGMRLVSSTPPGAPFVGAMNSDLAFTGDYVIQGNFNGFQVWDISDPASPVLVKEYVCPASQSDVSVHGNLLFVSGEGLEGRLDCGTEGVQEAASAERLRGIRIFDISDIRNPKYVANVQTCRGSHTHSVLVDPDDPENVYIYVSGSSMVRPAEELPGCSGLSPDEDPESALFRIEVIRVPLAHPERAEIVSSPRIFEGLVAPARHGPSPEDIAALEAARARGAFILEAGEYTQVLPDEYADRMLARTVEARGGTGAPTAADSAAVREELAAMAARWSGGEGDEAGEGDGPRPGPTQCHDITLYPEIGLAGGACEGYGLLIDISDPVNPKRIAAVADSNFSYWHSATFNNDGTSILFSDEWGGGGGPKCRAGDPLEWGANAIFSIADGEMTFESYYKMPAPQTSEENCVAHNGSMIPIPGRDVMVQSWYQGGVSVFDFTDPANPVEIAYFDRGPVDATRMAEGGTWSAYWHNGLIVSSEIARGLDVLELVPTSHLSASEIEAAKTVVFDEFNVQGQQRFVWPATFALARAYVDQIERLNPLASDQVEAIRSTLDRVESAPAAERSATLSEMASHLEHHAAEVEYGAKVRALAATLRELAAM
jgi:hypothetical protein